MFDKRRKDWLDTLREKTKLKDRIKLTVADPIKASLRSVYTVRQWLTELRNTMALPLATLRDNIQVEYQKLMGTALQDWPTGGPSNWLAKWEKIINQAARHDEPLRTWLRDVGLVWERVPDLAFYFKQVKRH